MAEEILKLGIPTGSLQKATIELFSKAGFHISDSERSYSPTIDDEQIQPICLRAQEMSRYIEDGALDTGITGYDWIMENGSDVVQVAELAYSKTTSRPTRWVPNKQAWQDKFKREKIENLSILLNAAIDARSKVGLKMNVKKNDLEHILKILPAEKSPTISSLADSDYAAVEVVIEDKIERSLVPALKRAGASGIITYPLNKVIH